MKLHPNALPNAENFTRNPYPGRVIGISIVIGSDGKRRLVLIYAITARSMGRRGSHNRVLIEEEDGSVRAKFAIDPEDPEKDRTLYEYMAMCGMDDPEFCFVSNGNHLEAFLRDYRTVITLLGALNDQTFEPDRVHTPRIIALANISPEDGYNVAEFLIIRRDPISGERESASFECRTIPPGTGRFICTYDPNPESLAEIPSYSGNPAAVVIEGNDAESIAKEVWNFLGPANGQQDLRVCIAVRTVDMDGEVDQDDGPIRETFIYNRYTRTDPGTGINELIEGPTFE